MAVFFDLDNTLSDDDHAVSQACQHFYDEFSSHLNSEFDDFFSDWHILLNKYSALYFNGQMTFQEQRRNRVREIFKQSQETLDDRKCDNIFDVYLKQYESNWKACSDVMGCINKLSDVKLGIITNGDGNQQRRKLEKLGLNTYFDPIIISKEVGYDKPNPQIFKIACDRINQHPNECFYVGDRYETDAIASKKAGMNGIWLNRKENGIAKDNVKTIFSLNEIPFLIENN